MKATHRIRQWRQGAGSRVIDSLFGLAGVVGRTHPLAHLAPKIERLSDIRYRPSSERSHLLDIYRPRHSEGKLPVVMYVHGGSFRILSKDTHWLAGGQFASQGMLCVNVNYRLAPANPYPCQLEDVLDALRWVKAHVADYGGDPTRLVLAGESAGANLALALTVGSCFEFDNPMARKIWDVGGPAYALMPACGILEVTRPERFDQDPRTKNWLIRDRIRTVTRSYLPNWSRGDPSVPLADPLVVLESERVPSRPLPPMFVGCGDADPIAEDSSRLGRALAKRGVKHRLAWYRGQPHAFQMLIWRDEAKRFWKDSFDFIAASGVSPPRSES